MAVFLIQEVRGEELQLYLLELRGRETEKELRGFAKISEIRPRMRAKAW